MSGTDISISTEGMQLDKKEVEEALPNNSKRKLLYPPALSSKKKMAQKKEALKSLKIVRAISRKPKRK